MLRVVLCILALTVVLLGSVSAQTVTNELSSGRIGERDQRREFTLNGETSQFKFKYSDLAAGAGKVESAAALQLTVDKNNNKFLATLPNNGEAQFLTALKPCGIILPHVHQRATEFYSIMYGTMGCGIAQENGAAQNITFNAGPGEVFVVPQGLLHFNQNGQCDPLAFFQTFNSADPGPALNVISGLAGLASVNPAVAKASNFGTVNTQGLFGAFGLDQDCLARCNLPATGGTLDKLPDAIKAMFGLPVAAPAGAATAASAATPAGAATPAAGGKPYSP